MAELTLQAKEEELDQALDFVSGQLENYGCPMKALTQILIAVEEIFINIATYAYCPEDGSATIQVEVLEKPLQAILTFIDRGVPYDPMKKEDPDITLSAEEREIGGLGIYMVKKSMDEVSYRYEDGKNILTVKKEIH